MFTKTFLRYQTMIFEKVPKTFSSPIFSFHNVYSPWIQMTDFAEFESIYEATNKIKLKLQILQNDRDNLLEEKY